MSGHFLVKQKDTTQPEYSDSNQMTHMSRFFLVNQKQKGYSKLAFSNTALYNFYDSYPKEEIYPK